MAPVQAWHKEPSKPNMALQVTHVFASVHVAQPVGHIVQAEAVKPEKVPSLQLKQPVEPSEYY